MKSCEKKSLFNFEKNKKAQVTIFIIIAVVVVALVALFFMYSPKLKLNFTKSPQNPEAFIQECIQDQIQNNVKKLSLQGGSIEPESFILYQDEKIEYLCYTNEYYKPCVVQQPLLKSHIESEIKNAIKSSADICFNSLKETYEKKGYQVNLKKGETKVELLPKRILTTFNTSLSLTKGETKKYDSFRIILNDNLYELLSVANSIVNWETTTGDAEITTYMNYYHDLKVEKKKTEDGTKIYILTDRNNENKFQFASRSVVFPPGY